MEKTKERIVSLEIFMDLLKQSPELLYALLIFALFIIPQFLSRFMVPPALTAFFFGIFFANIYMSSGHDPTMHLLASVGISSLFLFAGLEVDVDELQEHGSFILQHIFLKLLVIVLFSYLMSEYFNLSYVSSGIFALAVLTPSAGFILDHLKHASFDESNRLWIRLKVIASEIVALGIMFVLMRSESVVELSFSFLSLLLLIFIIPLLFKLFAKIVLPYAPGSEFAFLVMFAIIAGLITKRLGAYYLVGAFVVGVGARRFEKILPSIASENIITSLKNFSAFFMPFYFFNEGMHFSARLISWKAIAWGAALAFVVGLLRISIVCVHRKLVLKESFKDAFPISVMLLPNLVFGLVLASYLEKKSLVPPWAIGALVVYTIVITAIPPILYLIAERPDLKKSEMESFIFTFAKEKKPEQS